MHIVPVLLFSLVSAINSYQIQQIEGIIGASETINFDSKGNSYVVVNNNEHRQFYKINPAKKILWNINISSEVYKIIINTHDDIYVIFWPDEKSIILTIFHEHNFQFHEIDFIKTFEFALDDDIILYNRENGVHILTRHSTTPKPIKNLEDYSFSGEKSVIVDNNGNIYLGINSLFGFISSIAVISNDSKRTKNPSADILPVSQDHHIMDSIFFDQNYNLWAVTWDFNKNGYIKKLINNTLETIVYDEKYQYHTPTAIKDRIYVISLTDNAILAPIYFMTLDNKIVEIPELANLSWYQWYTAKPLSDRNGNAYFAVKYPFDAPINSPLALVKYGEVRAIGIEFENYESIVSLFLDRGGVLWVLTDGAGVHYVQEGELRARKVESSSGDWDSTFKGINLNAATDEVYVLSENGLFVVK